MSGIAESTLFEWANNREPRSPVKAKMLADALDISLNELLFDERDQPQKIELQSLLKEDVFSGVFEISIKRVKEKR